MTFQQYASWDIHLATGCVRGRRATRPTGCPRSSGIAELRIISTTGARRAGTNGPTGITRCGNTSARTTQETTNDSASNAYSADRRRMRISDIRYEDGSSLKKILQGKL